MLVELLAAVPSVVFGLWGLYVFVPIVVKPLGVALNSTLGFLPIFAGPVFGPSRLAAGLLLAIMVLPDDHRDQPGRVPGHSGGAARGDPLPSGRRAGRPSGGCSSRTAARGSSAPSSWASAAPSGETIAVTMVIGNNLDLTPSLLHPGYTMASVIANEFTEAT